MNEWWMIATTAWCLVAFAAGGTDIPGTGGKKWIRRFIMPAGLIALGCFLTQWWQAVGYGLTLCGILHLGYGDRAKWWYRAGIFAGYGLASLWIGWSWWALMVGPIAYALFALSRWKVTARIFPWKYVEMSYGLLIAWSYCSAF